MPFIPKNKKSGLYLSVIIIIVGVAAGYYYYSQLIKPFKQPIELPEITMEDTLGKFKDMESFNFQVLSNVVFKSLKLLSEIPVKPGLVGREDIFAPY